MNVVGIEFVLIQKRRFAPFREYQRILQLTFQPLGAQLSPSFCSPDRRYMSTTLRESQ